LKWNNQLRQIDIKAVARETNDKYINIDGNVSLAKNNIELLMNAHHANIAFVHSFTSSIFSNISGETSGNIRLFGPLNKLNLEGMLTASGKTKVSALNTIYKFTNDTIIFRPNEIAFKNADIIDRRKHHGYINGSLYHEDLKNLSYNLHITTQDLLGYDFHEFGENTFYGTVYGTGKVDILGKSGIVNINVNMTPEKGSSFIYNAESTNNNAEANAQFITFRDKTPHLNNFWLTLDQLDSIDNETEDIPTDIKIDFLLNMNPEATIKVIMDNRSGDYISLNGDGIIRASYYNKGKFELYGNYKVDHGMYKLTLQDIIHKDFRFQEG